MRHFTVALFLSGLAWAQPALVVEAEPSSALIFVDRQLQGSGKVSVEQLTPGKHLLRISAGPDWETEQRNLDWQGQPLRLTIKLKPGAAKWLSLGRAALEQSDWSEAVHAFQQASGARPVEAAWWEGIAHWKAGQTSLALQCLRTYAQYQPKVPQLNWALGSLHEKLGQFGPAFTAYKMAALAQPEYASALNKLPAPSERAIAELKGRTSGLDQLRLGQLLMLKGRHQEACAAVKRSLGESFSDIDWLHWQPPVPKAPTVEVAPPEDQVP
jgi:tetratricopeptide (TPR) repeat protein